MKTHLETARGTLWRRLLQAAGLAIVATSLTAASCGKTNNYDYIDVNVFVDPNSINKLAFVDPAQVASCEMYVTGSEMSASVQIPCMPTQQSYPGLGTFEWTTTLGKGSLQFTVTLYALNRVPFAIGTSDPLTIMPGQKQTANVVVTLVPNGMTGTGGAGGAGAGTGGVTGTGGSSGVGGAGGGSAGTGGVGGSGASGSGGMAGAGGMPGTGGAGGRGGAGGAAGHGGSTGTGGAAGAGGSTSGGGGVGGTGTAGAGGDNAGGAGGS